MTELPSIRFDWPEGPPPGEASGREWLVTNGLGGYASGTLAMCNARRYHGLLVATLPGQGRTVMLSHLDEEASAGAAREALSLQEGCAPDSGSTDRPSLRAFRLDGLIPEWEFDVGDVRLARRLVLVHRQNTVFVSWRNASASPLRLRIRPYPAFRPHDQLAFEGSPRVLASADRLELFAREGAAPLRVRVYATRPVPFVLEALATPELLLHTERARGYDHRSRLVSPGYFEGELGGGDTIALAFTAEPWEALDPLTPDRAFALERQRELRLLENAPSRDRTGIPARLVLAADQFLIEPTVRPADEAWAQATGQDARSVIAGYPWFTDWGRDTMISLEGLTLLTRRFGEAAAILRTFDHYVRDGLLPNLFPEGEREGRYNTADATLWFFHAIDRYLRATGDDALLRELFPRLAQIVARHREGTRFHIGVDPKDGLLTQGYPGTQLTWMDALVEGWVVTPRRGKAVEINALWFNALSLMEGWARQLGEDPEPYRQGAERARASFNARFWNPEERCLFDVVDGEHGDDASIRPNQIFAISLPHAVLAQQYWRPVLEKVRGELFTPVGLRTLSPSDPNYKPTYDGDLRSRDAAYHQGTVWPWLLGAFVDAWVRTHGDANGARAVRDGIEAHLTQVCVGQLGEIFDAQAPHRPRGGVAQAWSVAEGLRAWLKTEAAV